MPTEVLIEEVYGIGFPQFFRDFLDKNGAHKIPGATRTIQTPEGSVQHERWHILKHRTGLAGVVFGIGGRELTVTIDHLPTGAMRLVGTDKTLRYISRESHAFEWPPKSNR